MCWKWIFKGLMVVPCPKISKTHITNSGRSFPRSDGLPVEALILRHYTIKVDGKPKCCGPYYCLTWKEDNKTRTKALSTQQYKLFSKAIANQRKLDQILSKMRRISTRFIHQSTQGVPKRNRVKSTKKSA